MTSLIFLLLSITLKELLLLVIHQCTPKTTSYSLELIFRVARRTAVVVPPETVQAYNCTLEKTAFNQRDSMHLGQIGEGILELHWETVAKIYGSGAEFAEAVFSAWLMENKEKVQRKHQYGCYYEYDCPKNKHKLICEFE
ncbi:hypothetical protein OESDEN_11625 [Oesophagostomum dentatum]|uniref:SCP domain-containing protein n=1 Tax=Oesophagostomum dentatum TaxID=61180 RepID=A0A0B1SUF9_OESDE|nr:hypothetical protein OESDEN_11625 [Oesophagostomum dentatum]